MTVFSTEAITGRGPETPRIAMLANADLSGVVRGRSFPIERLDELRRTGLPWVPANILLSPVNTIPPGNPFGPVGETRLRAGSGLAMTMPARGERPAALLQISDICTTDDAPWPVCPRGQLARAVDDLAAQHGLRLEVGFEHELFITGLQDRPTPAFSLAGTRAASGLAEDVQAMLRTAGTRLDQFAAEFGAHQFEISAPIHDALTAADHAVLAREAIRDAARARGAHASFAPKPFAEAPGSGVHIHLSLWRGDTPVTAAEDRLSAEASAFLAGILAHLPALLGFTLASANSFERLLPSNWVGIYRCWGERNREAAVRFCPRGRSADGRNAGASLEYRLADGSASPHLALAALIRAGMDGLAEGAALPAGVDCDPAGLSAGERADRGIDALPASLEVCLDGLEESGLAGAWFGETLAAALMSVRRNDVADAARLGDRYRDAFSATI
ncbi:MAG: glutamine synthetase family protein [Pseudomonadota bacterium]